HPDQDSLIPGVIRILEKGSDHLLQWTPLEEGGDAAQIVFSKKEPPGAAEEEPFDPGYEPDWAVISTVRPRPQEEPPGSVPPPGPRAQWAFTLSLSELQSIRRGRPGLGWSYLIFISRESGSLPALHFHRGGSKALLRALCKYLILAISPKDSRLYLVYSHDSYALSHAFDQLQLFDENSSNLVSRFLQDPYTATFGGFSKVTSFFRGALHHEAGAPLRPPGAAAASLEDEPGFEVITCQVQLGPRPAVCREAPVTEQEWGQHLDPEGRITHLDGLKRRIFAGGLTPALRKEAWKFLLGYYSWESSSEENRAQARDEYFRMKLQWKSVSEEQERRNSLLRGYRSLIGQCPPLPSPPWGHPEKATLGTDAPPKLRADAPPTPVTREHLQLVPPQANPSPVQASQRELCEIRFTILVRTQARAHACSLRWEPCSAPRETEARAGFGKVLQESPPSPPPEPPSRVTPP
uniref:TBC1 domain family member 17 n=1 Tax=Terrapene triunguis TaxID=2587831 RepID=A0A674JUV7_9SAUR